MPDISKLLTAKQLSDRTGGRITEDRITEFAEAELIPHYELDGTFYFASQESQQWLNSNAVTYVAGRDLPMSVSVTPIMIKEREDVTIPDALKGIRSYLCPLELVSLQFASFPGIYFLCDGDEVVYVGQSICVAGRVGAHLKDKVFDYAYCFRVPRSDLDAVESAFIHALKPKYNISGQGRLIAPSRSLPLNSGAVPLIEYADSISGKSAMSLRGSSVHL